MTMRVPKPKLTSLIDGLRDDIDALKTTGQHMSGDSLRGYLTDSGQPYDYTFVLPAAPGTSYSIYVFYLTFTNVNATSGAMVTGFFNYSVGNPNVTAYAVPPWSNGYYMEYQKLTPTNTTSSWKFIFSQAGAYNATIYFKWTFTGTDTGTVSITT